MIEIYAITTDPPPDVAGLGDLQTVSSSGLAAVCAPARDQAVTPELLWEREDLIEALMERRDLLPVRYGTRVDDEVAAARALAERRDELMRALERIHGAVELSLRVQGAHRAPDGPARTGAGYLAAKAGAAGERARVRRGVHEPLAALARASAQTTVASGRELLRAAYLVERGAVTEFASRVRELQEANGDWRLLCTGPWPPYSFVDT
ncbi:MAG TPA: GvpL/GvpF family gas vesicle protein [Thermoleophilaceae bacterium]|jgi:hypothetical protein|nr:GvpL/GvpF family gas vesicle protein [Thermoleophilaceae bacterium]